MLGEDAALVNGDFDGEGCDVSAGIGDGEDKAVLIQTLAHGKVNQGYINILILTRIGGIEDAHQLKRCYCIGIGFGEITKLDSLQLEGGMGSLVIDLILGADAPDIDDAGLDRRGQDPRQCILSRGQGQDIPSAYPWG